MPISISTTCFYRRRKTAKRDAGNAKWPASSGTDPVNFDEMIVRGQEGLWNDDVVTAKRIPRDKVTIKKVISRGAYGEVHLGHFNGRQVAVKMLLPSTRGSLNYVNEFLAEAKMTAALDHPHIVSCVGIAWDSLADLCVVLEFVEGGDLRALLNGYLALNHPVGFDRQKATIALNICQALTYLHSLAPPVIHRDLKSRNVLLNDKLKAKLSDFGISRERLDRTMTACVGTSLWMAPEVMLGERYDVKADMFSFGVVLSELDVHKMPYAVKENPGSSGREAAGVQLFQKIALGTVQVEFSDSSPRTLVELGRACTSLDPAERPNAAEAMQTYTLSSLTTAETMYSVCATFLGDQCDGTPYIVTVLKDSNCTAMECSSYSLINPRSAQANMQTCECSTDYLQTMRNKFESSPYLIQILHSDKDCSRVELGFGYPATVGHASPTNSSRRDYREGHHRNSLMRRYMFRWYSSNDIEGSSQDNSALTKESESGLSTNNIIGVAAGCLMVMMMVFFVAMLILTRRFRRHAAELEAKAKIRLSKSGAAWSGPSGLWTDDAITT
ncbi:unnamed protein product [Phytophthora lilii]|uniref:Unnamed protein product n=1 Tax=Phytophthora lilii TaxID=2077276 RepID=A0A9W6WWG7_9STRA|nr:unnamed protein product [Phytophthora lilii]